MGSPDFSLIQQNIFHHLLDGLAQNIVHMNPNDSGDSMTFFSGANMRLTFVVLNEMSGQLLVYHEISVS